MDEFTLKIRQAESYPLKGSGSLENLVNSRISPINNMNKHKKIHFEDQEEAQQNPSSGLPPKKDRVQNLKNILYEEGEQVRQSESDIRVIRYVKEVEQLKHQLNETTKGKREALNQLVRTKETLSNKEHEILKLNKISNELGVENQVQREKMDYLSRSVTALEESKLTLADEHYESTEARVKHFLSKFGGDSPDINSVVHLLKQFNPKEMSHLELLRKTLDPSQKVQLREESHSKLTEKFNSELEYEQKKFTYLANIILVVATMIAIYNLKGDLFEI